MPSSKVRDDLPNHSRGWLVKLLAEAVIAGVGRSRSSGTAPRTARLAMPAPSEPEVVDSIVVEDATKPTQRALPASPTRHASEDGLHAQQIRERLKRHQARIR